MSSDQNRNLKVEHQNEHKERENQGFGVHFYPLNSDCVSMKNDIILGYFCRIRKSFNFCLSSLNIETKDASAEDNIYKIFIKCSSKLWLSSFVTGFYNAVTYKLKVIAVIESSICIYICVRSFFFIYCCMKGQSIASTLLETFLQKT